MKRIFALLLVTLLLSFAACGGDKPDETDGDTTAAHSQTQATTKTDPVSKETTGKTENQVNPDTWGVADRVAAGKGDSEVYFINSPYYTGYAEGYGLFAEQLDDTAVIIFGENDDSPEITSISELFPACFGQLQYTVEKIYGSRASNVELTLTGNAPAKVGDYNMHSFTGTISFDYKGNPREYSFVAYATTLKSNGAYAYWVVYDISDDQSKGDLIAEHALNMAKTFREEE